MDKEAVERIAVILATYNLPREPDSNSSSRLLRMERENCARHRLAELGYRKLPQAKPPLLSDEELENLKTEYEKILEVEWHPTVLYLLAVVAQAQREADIKFYSMGKPPFSLGFVDE